jgi:holin-like protein
MVTVAGVLVLSCPYNPQNFGGFRTMIPAITLLLIFQLVGEALANLLAIPVPGPVIGMALLFITLVVRGGPSEALKSTSNGLLQNLSLLFVPAGAGILLHLNRLAEDWLPIALAVLISTLLTLSVSALLIQWLDRRKAVNHD